MKRLRWLGIALAWTAARTVAAPPSAGSELAQQIRAAGLDPAECYRVRDLTLAKEDLKLYFTEGYLIFSKPVSGERVSAVFSADVEGGDGEVLLLPPYRGERASLARFAKSPNLDEHLRAAVLMFSDGSAQKLLSAIEQGGGKKAAEMGPLLVEQWTPVLANIESGFALRLVEDLLTPQARRSGLLFGALAGKTLGNFDVYFDSRNGNQITVGRAAQREGRDSYDIWTSFPARSSRNASGQAAEPSLTERSYQIDAALDPDLGLKASVHTTIRVGGTGLRTLPFDLAHALQVDTARVDGEPAELLFAEQNREGVADLSDNSTFLVIPAHELAPGSEHRIEFEEHGKVISPAGNNVYFVAARANWYPRAGSGLSTYDLTFRYPKRLTLVTPGEVAEDRVDGDFRVTRRVTSVPIRIAGFNLGDYVQAAGSPDAENGAGVHVEVYGNRGLEAALQPKTQPPAGQEQLSSLPRRGIPPRPPLPNGPPPPQAPNPLARLQAVAADINSALQFYTGLFGPPALKTLTVSPIPAGFGQGFPGLVYLSTLSYLDPNQRPETERGPRAQLFYSDLIEAHEVAHQWWGNIVMPATYQDEWLSEAVADYSALLYLEKKKGSKAMEDVLEDFRDILVRRDANGETTESAGPIAWGYRLDGSGNPAARNDITYDKGAWVLHMLRRRMGDGPFLKMLAELRKRYDSRAVSTAQFAALVKEFIPPRAAGGPAASPAFNVDSFFDNWVYSTGIPDLKLNYAVKGTAPAIKLSGTIEQSGVDDDFSIEVPVEVQFANGSQTIWVATSNDGATFSASLKQAPLKVSIPIGRRVLAVKK